MSNRVALVTGVPAVLVPLSVKSFTLRDSRSSPVITRAATMTKPKHGKQNSALMALNLTSHTAMFQILNQRVSASRNCRKSWQHSLPGQQCRDHPRFNFSEDDPEQWDQVMNANLRSVFNMTRLVINGMLEEKWGRVINISSVNGQKGQFGQSNYAAAKAGMHGFTKSLAQEVASKGITVNTVSPGYIMTAMVAAIGDDILEKIASTIPIGRLGNPDEIAYAVAFLASERAAFVTGSNLAINGGQHMF